MSYADLFEIPPDGLYLLAHSAGCLPVRSRGELEAKLLAPWAASGAAAWDVWLPVFDDFRDGLARLLGGQRVDFCPQANLSAGLFALLSSLTLENGRHQILMSAHAFASIGFVAQTLERLGYRLALIDGDPGDCATWEAAMTKDVAAVVPMHVHSNRGVVSPVAEIVALGRARGIVSVIDIAQSAGILPINLMAWDADAVIGSCLKWLCGGPGAGFLWANPKIIDRLKPLSVGWFSHENPFEFDIRDFRYAADARRFWGGTPSVAPFVLAASGIRQILDIGVETIFTHNRSLISRIAAATPDRWQAQLERTGKGGTLCLEPVDIEALSSALKSNGCRFDQRGDTLRLSFHIWNTHDEADIIAGCLT